MSTENKGICDGCGEMKYPQIYVGQGIMLCPVCLEEHNNIFKPIFPPPSAVKTPVTLSTRNATGTAGVNL